MKISDDVMYIGVNDHVTDLFEGQYAVPDGMAYNSYVVLDEKVAVLDTVDAKFTREWLANLQGALAGRQPDYLIVQHMEPDHSASLADFIAAYPQAVVVGNQKTFSMIERYFEGVDLGQKKMTVENGAVLSLGRHELTLLFAPMVHWPEVMLTYDSLDKVLFSADAFGKFGALDAGADGSADWACEARRYYIGIVGKYGAQVQALLKKTAALDVRCICPLHGPVLRENLGYYLKLYDIWSSYGVESEGVVIAYTSVYGHTKKAVALLEQGLKKRGCSKVVVNDLARMDMAEAVEDAFRYGTLVLATTTYNADIFPFMKQFIDHLRERNFQNRRVGLIENGSWAPMAAKVMRDMLAPCKNIAWLETTVKIDAALNAGSRAQLEAMADELCGR